MFNLLLTEFQAYLHCFIFYWLVKLYIFLFIAIEFNRVFCIFNYRYNISFCYYGKLNVLDNGGKKWQNQF